MKYTIITICILFSVLCLLSSARGASEINAFAPGVSTAYAVVRNQAGSVWYVTGQVFEAWGTAGRTAADYDIALTDKSGDMFVGDFDTNISAGTYWIASHYQAGGSPADSDPVVWVERGRWDGDEWFGGALASDVNDAVDDLSDINDVLTDILADTNEIQTDLTDGGRLDLILDSIKYKTDLITLLDTTVKDANDANNFKLTAGPDTNDVYWAHVISVTDANDGHTELRSIAKYEYGTDVEITVDTPFSFTPAASDVVHIMGIDYLGLQYIINYNVDKATRPVYSYTGPGYPSSGTGSAGTGSYSVFQGNGYDP